ncbi:phosphate/phosphite/phosphonate ABC transporter substrate-binding protein [Ramlibacter sp. AN1133]|uniref:phosphate/phosphite/phosphonate ABC transporter substrate-binding protein n=1 Tax=Ramlibacter sp. AN1133 TaxID=3133429 RepID=UPI0030C504AC
MPVANARMYSATPRVKHAWQRLLCWVLADAALPWEVVDHDAPAPLNALWARDDLGLAMMCGLPCARRTPAPQVIAAPIPSPPRYQGLARYCTDLVVRADAPFQRLEDTFGGIAAYTLADSMSGGVAFNAHLQAFRSTDRPRLYARSVGNLVNARGVIDALARGEVDVGPLDSYFHDLLRQDDPAYAGQVRTIASTRWTPIPPLVATATLPLEQVMSLRASLRHALAHPDLAPERACLLLAGFATPEASEYDVLGRMADEALPPFEEL